MRRRDFVQKLAALGLGCSLGAPALTKGANSPTHDLEGIELVVPFGANGITSQVARYFQVALSNMTGLPVQVAHQHGYTGMKAVEYAERHSRPQRPSLLIAGAVVSTAGVVASPMHNVRAVDQFRYVASLYRDDPVLIARQETVATLDDLKRVPLASRKCGISGVGAAGHLFSEMISRLAQPLGTYMVTQGDANAIERVLSGELTTAMVDKGSCHRYLDRGLSFLVNIGDGPVMNHRNQAVVTLAELLGNRLKGSFFYYSWDAVLAPTNVPTPLIESLALDFQKIMAMPEYRAFRGERGLAALNLSERDFSRFVAQQRKVWEQAVEFFNINAEEAFSG